MLVNDCDDGNRETNKLLKFQYKLDLVLAGRIVHIESFQKRQVLDNKTL